MAKGDNADVGCRVVGEYVDDAEVLFRRMPSAGEAVHAKIVANYVDVWGQADSLTEFTVLLNDGRVAAVRGQSLKHLPNIGEEPDTDGVVRSPRLCAEFQHSRPCNH